LSELASGQLPFSDCKEFIQREEKVLSKDQLKDNELMELLTLNGFEVADGLAIKEVFNVCEKSLMSAELADSKCNR
jgi:hypothetical protein